MRNLLVLLILLVAPIGLAGWEGDGSGDYVEFGNHADFSLEGTNAGTLLIRFKRDQSALRESLFSLRAANWSNPHWELMAWNSDTPPYTQDLTVVSGSGNYYSGFSLTAGTWYTIVVRLDGSAGTYDVFSSGTEVASDVSFSTYSTCQDGPRMGAGSYAEFDGQIEYVAYWNTQLTDRECQKLSRGPVMLLPLQVQTSNLKLYSVFSMALPGTAINGYSVQDLSGNHNTGTCTNGTARGGTTPWP